MRADKYKNFRELSRDFRRGVDYQITSVPRPASGVAVLAIHGGKIEPGTAEIARAIAGDDLGLYVFDAMINGNAWDMHVTSNNYDEPEACRIAAASRICVSIHGFREGEKMQVCIGGANDRLKKLVFDRLLATGLLEQDTPNPLVDKFTAESPANIVNRCAEGGVQIEVSRALRDLLRHDAGKMQCFSAAVRRALADYHLPPATPRFVI